MLTRLVLFLTLCLAGSALAHAEDWPQWRGKRGQGTSFAQHLPPQAGSSSLKVLWKTPIPGEGCSSPIVSKGRVYVTTAYEGSERHAWDAPAQVVGMILALCVLGLALAQTPHAVRAVAARPVVLGTLGLWTIAVLALTMVVLARPAWFWQYADPWTGTTVAPAELPWVESFGLRPLIVLAFGSLVLIFISLSGKTPTDTGATPSLFASWLSVVTLTVTLLGAAVLD